MNYKNNFKFMVTSNKAIPNSELSTRHSSAVFNILTEFSVNGCIDSFSVNKPTELLVNIAFLEFFFSILVLINKLSTEVSLLNHIPIPIKHCHPSLSKAPQKSSQKFNSIMFTTVFPLCNLFDRFNFKSIFKYRICLLSCWMMQKML